MNDTYHYVVVGCGLTSAWAVSGIREHDKTDPILLVGNENHLPYERPPLSKELWFGQKKVEEIFPQNQEFYDKNQVELLKGKNVTFVDVEQKKVTDDTGKEYKYDKLLLATGGIPRALPIPGGNLEQICYYRYLDDYYRIRARATKGSSATIIGGGFIGSEMAAALCANGVEVTMVFPSPYLVDRVFPEYLARAIEKNFIDRGIKIIRGEKPASITRKADRFNVLTSTGKEIESDIVIAGIGIQPLTELAEKAGLKTGNGIVVDEYLRTSNPDVYAAGDNAFFLYSGLDVMMRVEHWDNAINQGKYAGWNMAGAQQKYTYMPYFFSVLFEFGYEAVGEIDSRLETFADWKKENDTGVIYYLKHGKVRGAMMCNIWGKTDEARALIRKGAQVSPEDLRGAIQEN